MKRSIMRLQWLPPCFWGLVVAFAACGGDDSNGGEPLRCVENLNAQCVPSFSPTWDNVYRFVIEPRCGGASGGNCHGRDGMQGGLGLFTKTDAFAGLVGGEGGEPRVIPGDAACSTLIERLETTDPKLRMPRGASTPLPAKDRCAVQQWIAQGANP